MNCRKVWPLLSAYLDSELHENLAAQVQDHLGACPACAQRAKALGGARNLLRAMRDPEPPAGLWSNVYRRIREEHLARRKARRAWALVWRTPRVLLPAMAAVVAALLFFLVLPLMGVGQKHSAPVPFENHVTQHLDFAVNEPLQDRPQLEWADSRASMDSADNGSGQ